MAILNRVWRNNEGRDCIETYAITGMGHGTPLDTLRGDRYGAIGAHMLEAGISSTFHIARFWGLTRAIRGAAIRNHTVRGIAA